MAGDAVRGRQFSRLKDSQDTGENRCLPCTVLDLVVAATGAAALGVALVGATALGLLVAIGVFTSATSVVHLRGYLVPGTPRHTGRCLTDRALAWFGTEPPAGTDRDRTGAGAERVDPEALFRRIGIVEASPSGDLVLDPTFKAAWIDAVDEFAGTTDALREPVAAVAEVDPDGLELERRHGSFEAYHEERPVARWESKAACQADVAAAAIMPVFDAEWGNRAFRSRSELLGALRLFVEICPTCLGRVSFSEEVVTACCGSHEVVAATCEGCNARVFEVRIDAVRFDAERDGIDGVETH